MSIRNLAPLFADLAEVFRKYSGILSDLPEFPVPFQSSSMSTFIGNSHSNGCFVPTSPPVPPSKPDQHVASENEDHAFSPSLATSQRAYDYSSLTDYKNGDAGFYTALMDVKRPSPMEDVINLFDDESHDATVFSPGDKRTSSPPSDDSKHISRELLNGKRMKFQNF